MSNVRRELGEYFAYDALLLRNAIKKKWTGGYEVKASAQVFTELWVFQKGAVIGASKADKKNAVARLIAQVGHEESVLKYLQEITEQSLKEYGKEPSSFYDFFTRTRFKGMDFGDIKTYKFLNSKKYRLREVLPHFQEATGQGIGLGINNPQLVKNIWEKQYETKEDQTTLEKVRQLGVDLPEQQSISPWKEMEEIVLAQVLEYAEENDPDVIPLLGLKRS